MILIPHCTGIFCLQNRRKNNNFINGFSCRCFQLQKTGYSSDCVSYLPVARCTGSENILDRSLLGKCLSLGNFLESTLEQNNKVINVLTF